MCSFAAHHSLLCSGHVRNGIQGEVPLGDFPSADLCALLMRIILYSVQGTYATVFKGKSLWGIFPSADLCAKFAAHHSLLCAGHVRNGIQGEVPLGDFPIS